MAGTINVRTTNVSSSRPHPMMKPICTIVAIEPTIRPNMLAAKIKPAEVMTEPVLERSAAPPPGYCWPTLREVARSGTCCSRPHCDQDDE